MEPDGSFQNPTKRDVEYFGKIIENYYVYLDGVIGRYMEVAPITTTFFVISDHGFRAVTQDEFMPARALSGGHEKEGIYIFQGPEIKKGYRYDRLSILDISPILLYHLGLKNAQDMSGKVPLNLRTEIWPNKPALLASYGTNANQNPESVTTGADEETMEQLRTLGYIDD